MRKIILASKTSISFIKMNSQGNEFVLIDLAREKLKISDNNIQKIIHEASEDFDQLLLIDYEINSESIYCKIFNCDGSRAYQCGNGLRAIMLYLNATYGYSNIFVDIENKKYTVFIDDKKEITASMGVSRALKLVESDVRYLDSFERQNLVIGSIKDPIEFYLVELGNKHCVIVNQCTREEKDIITEYFDNHYNNLFNLEFVENPSDLFMPVKRLFNVSVYESGAGWTKSCGSGATAVASLFYGIHGNQVFDKIITIKQDGGELRVSKTDNNLLLTGPSTIEYKGTINV